MPRYLIRRALGDVTEQQVEAAAERSTRVREERFPEMTWEHSHIVRGADGVTAYCVYAAPHPQVLRDHAAASGLPADELHEIERSLAP